MGPEGNNWNHETTINVHHSCGIKGPGHKDKSRPFMILHNQNLLGATNVPIMFTTETN